MRSRLGACVVLLVSLVTAEANSFFVQASGTADYIINGLNDPTVRLYRGRSYTFLMNASGHPFWIKTTQTTGTGSAFTNGVTGNGTAVGTINFDVPTNAPSTLFYNCQFHAPMTGVISIENSPQKGWWRFETAGETVLDGSGWSVTGLVAGLNTGTDDGLSGYSPDVPGALVTDGYLTNQNLFSYRFPKDTTGLVWIVNPQKLNITNSSFTLEAFIKIRNPVFPMRIFHVEGTNRFPPTTLSPFLSDFAPAPWPAHSVISDTTTNFNTFFAPFMDPPVFASRQWHHFAVVQDGLTSTWYCNYQRIGSQGFAPYVPGSFTNVHRAAIGTWPGDPFNNFDGWIDEVRFTEHALAPTQFLRVVGGLAPGFDSMAITGATTHARFVSESGVVYRVDRTTNLLDGAGWAPIGGSITGLPFYTSVSNAGPPAAHFRVLRLP